MAPSRQNNTLAILGGAAILGLFLVVGMIGGIYVWRVTTPSVPPSPGPAPPTSLAALISDADDRFQIGSFYASMAHQTRTADALQTKLQLINAQALATSTFRAAYPIAPQPAVAAEIDRRFQQVIGTEPGPLDAATREAVAKVADGIAIELGVKPIPFMPQGAVRDLYREQLRTWDRPMLASE